jgi:hypothetical protein
VKEDFPEITLSIWVALFLHPGFLDKKMLSICTLPSGILYPIKPSVGTLEHTHLQISQLMSSSRQSFSIKIMPYPVKNL